MRAEETADDGTATTVTKVSRTYYAGAHGKSTLADGSTVERTRIGDGAIHVATTPAATDLTGTATATAVFEYLHRDHLGSVEAVTDASGSELVVLGHDPYGGRRKADWTAQLGASATETLLGEHGRRVSRGFTGHGHLDPTGLVHMNGRVYDPRLGRFPSPDPIVADPTSSQSWNLCSYVGNNPLSHVDPSGLNQEGAWCTPASAAMCADGGGSGDGYTTRSVTVTTIEYVYGTQAVTTSYWVPDEVEMWDPHLDMWVTVDQGGYQSETHTHWPVTAARTVQVPVDDGVADEPADWRSWVSIGVDFIPIVGNIKSGIEAATGRDFIAGEDLGALERAAAAAGIFASGLSKTAAKGVIAGAGAVTEAVARVAGAAKRGPFRSKLSAKGATPNVSDPGLQNLVDDLYKGARRPNHVGTGSTADAVRNELATGLPTHGRFHSEKARQYTNALTKWLRKNPNASHHDRLVAQSMLDDLNSALEGPR